MSHTVSWSCSTGRVLVASLSHHLRCRRHKDTIEDDSTNLWAPHEKRAQKLCRQPFPETAHEKRWQTLAIILCWLLIDLLRIARQTSSAVFTPPAATFSQRAS